MGFSKGGDSGGGGGGSPSFGDRLMTGITDGLKKDFPIASGIGSAVFGGKSGGQPAVDPTSINVSPLPTYDYMGQQPDLIGMNAQPKSSGGGSTLLKALLGG